MKSYIDFVRTAHMLGWHERDVLHLWHKMVDPVTMRYGTISPRDAVPVSIGLSAAPVLCYVSLPWCFFTTRELSKQWGDDWNDAPYEHNAGEPYPPSRSDIEKGDTWEIIRVAVRTQLNTPDGLTINSRYSVQLINQGVTPWLRDRHGNSGTRIMAGCSLLDFQRVIIETGGEVYSSILE